MLRRLFHLRRGAGCTGAVAAVMLSGGLALSGQTASLGPFESHADIGAPKIAGSAAFDPATGTFVLSAGGVNMWAERDEFHFVWRRLTGDFILDARVRFEGQGTDPHRKAGLVVRPSQEADAPYVDAVVHGDGLTSMQFRRTKGGVTEEKRFDITGADVLRLERRGGTYIASAAKFGDPFSTLEIGDLDLGDDVLAGLALCAHNPDVTERATFDNVRITKPAAVDFRPYRDYIGSVLEVLDVQTGHRRMLRTSPVPFEAPNWTTDGAALIYNRSGRAEGWGGLYRFDLATGQEALIDTGAQNRNNNDHVLSFDGTMLGISDQSQASGGRSTVYTVPVGGGTPRRITTASPSYMHGWSPDGKWLVFTGGRNGEFDIYRIASDGSGEEEKLTDYTGLDDGPEYSPDGQFIYFNSTRSGRMEIWRMRTDGSNPVQLTDDEYQNWFPHVSPDGKWIAIISFPKDVPIDDHPYYKRVYLRLMPAAGGPARVIAYVYGGQGTINVPSWSPDSTKVAFVSNTGTF
jgi:TolB protein